MRVGPTDRTIGTSDYFLNSKSEASKCFEEIDIWPAECTIKLNGNQNEYVIYSYFVLKLARLKQSAANANPLFHDSRDQRGKYTHLATNPIDSWMKFWEYSNWDCSCVLDVRR